MKTARRFSVKFYEALNFWFFFFKKKEHKKDDETTETPGEAGTVDFLQRSARRTERLLSLSKHCRRSPKSIKVPRKSADTINNPFGFVLDTNPDSYWDTNFS